MPGTKMASVSYETGSAVIGNDLPSGDVDALKYIRAIEAVGSEPSLLQDTPPDLELKVDGMMCQKNCGKTVQNALRSVKHVVWAIARYEKGDALLWGRDIDPQECIEVLDAVGYDAVEKISQSSESHDIDIDMGPDAVLDIVRSKGIREDNVKRLLVAQEGVTSVRVSIGSNGSRATVQIWGFIDVSKIHSALKGRGYDLYGEHEAIDSTSQKKFLASIKIKGLSSTIFTKSIEPSLRALPGIIRISPGLLAGKVDVSFRPEIVSADTIVSALQSSGCDSTLLELKDLALEKNRVLYYRVSGMSCANCATKIEKTLQSLPGIVTADVSCMTNKARLTVDETDSLFAGPRDIIDTVVELGYGCELEDAATEEDVDGNSADLIAWRRLLIVAVVLGLPITVLHLGQIQITPLRNYMDSPAACSGAVSAGQLIIFIFSVPLQLIVGYRYYRGAFLQALHLSFGMDLLVVTGTSLAFIYSVARLSVACVTREHTNHIFMEAPGMLLMFVTIGKFLEAYAKGKTSTAIRDLLRLQPRNVKYFVHIVSFHECLVRHCLLCALVNRRRLATMSFKRKTTKSKK